MPPEAQIELDSEFARVIVERSDSRCGPRLRIRDIVGGREVFLDPLQLETLAWTRPKDLDYLVDPSHSRWARAE